MVLALGGFIHSTQVLKLVSRVGFGFNSADSERAPVPACKEDYFTFRKVMCGASFFFPPAAITHFMFSSSKRAGGIGTQSGLNGLGSQKPKEDFFFGTLDFLWNYINSGAFKSVFRRQKGGKL